LAKRVALVVLNLSAYMVRPLWAIIKKIPCEMQHRFHVQLSILLIRIEQVIFRMYLIHIWPSKRVILKILYAVYEIVFEPE